MTTRSVADLLAALKPAGYVDGWIPIVRIDGARLSSHRVRLHKTDLISDLKKLPPGTRMRFQVREWTYERANYPSDKNRFRVRWVSLGTEEADEIEARHPKEYHHAASESDASVNAIDRLNREY